MNVGNSMLLKLMAMSVNVAAESTFTLPLIETGA